CSDYFRVAGMVALMRSKAWRWSAVGSASMGTSVVVAAMRTWLRGRGARCASRPPKVRERAWGGRGGVVTVGWVFVGEGQRCPGLAEVPDEVAGEHADQHVRLDA